MEAEVKRNTFLLLLIQALNVLGDDFFNIAIMWIIYADTESVMISGIAGVVWHLTDAIIAPIAGAIVDRSSKKKVMFVSNFLALLASVIIAINAFIFDGLPTWMALLSISIMNILSSFVLPARKSIIANMVKIEDMQKVNGSLSTVELVTSIFSSSLGSFVLAFAGLATSVMFDSFSYLLVLICFLLFNWKVIEGKSVVDQKKESSIIQELKDGIVLIKESRILKAFCLFQILINLTSFTGTYCSALIYNNFGDHPEYLGIIESFATVAAVLGSILSAKNKVDGVKYYPVFIFFMGIFMAVFGLSSSLLLSIVTFSADYFLLYIGNALTTLKMQYIKKEYMGRISGFFMTISTISIPLTTILAGILGETLSVEAIFVVSGVYFIFLSFVMDKIFKVIREER